MRITLTKAADVELQSAIDWYEEQASGLGQRFLAEFKNLGFRLSENPLQFPAVYKDFRKARFRRFPYQLFFKVHPGMVAVLACFHTRRNPRQWRRRTG